jgi:hypothetical protein
MPFLPPVVNFIYILWAAFLLANALTLNFDFDPQLYYEQIKELKALVEFN